MTHPTPISGAVWWIWLSHRTAFFHLGTIYDLQNCSDVLGVAARAVKTAPANVAPIFPARLMQLSQSNKKIAKLQQGTAEPIATVLPGPFIYICKIFCKNIFLNTRRGEFTLFQAFIILELG